jgi:hypothetical protein
MGFWGLKISPLCLRATWRVSCGGGKAVTLLNKKSTRIVGIAGGGIGALNPIGSLSLGLKR